MNDQELLRVLAELSEFTTNSVTAVEVQCRSLDDLHTALGGFAQPDPMPHVPSRVFGIPVVVKPDMHPGEVKAFDVHGRQILHHPGID